MRQGKVVSQDARKVGMELTFTFVHMMNWSLHCLTLALLMQSTMVERLMVEAAVTPVKDLPAPQGKTIIPDRARPLPKSLARDFS